jgi:four helix bundle protein
MSRDPGKLKVFGMADALVLSIYSTSRGFPIDERFGLQSQLRRSALSVPTNIVEGCARRSVRDYARFVGIATASASEARYLVGVATRLGYFDRAVARDLAARYSELIRALEGLLGALEARFDQGLRPEA